MQRHYLITYRFPYDDKQSGGQGASPPPPPWPELPHFRAGLALDLATHGEGGAYHRGEGITEVPGHPQIAAILHQCQQYDDPRREAAGDAAVHRVT